MVSSGQEAVDVWQTQPFDLLLMDLELPGMDGLEAARTIREREGRDGADALPSWRLRRTSRPNGMRHVTPPEWTRCYGSRSAAGSLPSHSRPGSPGQASRGGIPNSPST